MLIVLPPSEGKTAPLAGPSLDLASLSFPELSRTRARVLAELTRTCRTKPDVAAAALGLGPRQAHEIGVNSSLRRAPAGPAIAVYTGVLYDALDVATLSTAARRRLQSMVVISSALFGLVRPQDRIPAYRLSAGNELPGLGPLPALWRPPISAVLATMPGLILDLRSAAYVGLGPIPAAAADRTVTARVLAERAGKRSVISHHNKATKGHLVRALVDSGSKPRTVSGLLADLHRLGFRCEMHEASSGNRPAMLDVIVAG